MKKKIIIALSVVVVIAAIVCVVLVVKNNKDLPDEGTSTLTSTETWISKADNTEHKVYNYSLGTTAQAIIDEYGDSIVVNHKFIDDIPIYEVYDSKTSTGKILFFLHSQLSQKEEFLNTIGLYASAGYVCVAVDLECHGERKTDTATMSLQITVDTGKDLDTLIEYYQTVDYADANTFALIGFSQGGNIAYWYTAYGKYTPTAIAVACTTPNFKYQDTWTAIKNGTTIKSIWTIEQTNEFIEANNPINNIDKFANLPILSGNGLEDEIISITGSEELEKKLYDLNNTDAHFYYFENVGHNITEEFIQKILPFVKEYV